MIITSLHAENVLKYSHLDFNDLPAEGLIAISGANESGKSTIGETICFALFGRTFAVGPDDIEKVIRWGESRCQVRLGFRTPDGTGYEISRYLDRDGNHSARLVADGQHEVPLARGVESVSRTLFDRLGYDYAEFIESFYLAQREISAPHPHSGAVRMMSGVTPLEGAREAFAHEVENENAAIVAADENDVRVQEELAELSIEEGRLQRLQDLRERLSNARQTNDQRGEELNLKAEHYADVIPRMNQAKKSAGRSRFWQFLFLLVGAAAGGAWLMFTQQPDHELTHRLAELVTRYVPQWEPGYLPWLVYAAGGLGLFALLLWMGEAGARRRLRDLRGEVDGMLEKLDGVREYRHSGDAVNELEDLAEGVQIDYPDEGRLDALRSTIAAFSASPKDVREAAQIENSWLDQVIAAEGDVISLLNQEIDTESGRLDVQRRLVEEQERYRQSIEESGHRIQVRERATDLVNGSIKRMAQNFNRDLRELTAETLPLFTEDRYQHIQLDDKLEVRVFSRDKGDFVDFDEISSGTQRQVMLAVRLSMSQLLARNTVGGAQFVFLDEPFAFFDEERTRHALQTLPKMTGLPQKWIVAQHFPDTANFDKHLTCSRYELNLRV